MYALQAHLAGTSVHRAYYVLVARFLEYLALIRAGDESLQRFHGGDCAITLEVRTRARIDECDCGRPGCDLRSQLSWASQILL